jgi:hypothetical protein
LPFSFLEESMSALGEHRGSRVDYAEYKGSGAISDLSNLQLPIQLHPVFVIPVPTGRYEDSSLPNHLDPIHPDSRLATFVN